MSKKTVFFVALVIDEDEFYGAQSDGSPTTPVDVLNYLNIATQDEGIGPFMVWGSMQDMLHDAAGQVHGITADFVVGG